MTSKENYLLFLGLFFAVIIHSGDVFSKKWIYDKRRRNNPNERLKEIHN